MRLRSFFVIILVSCALISEVLAQKESTWWYFTHSAGLQFNFLPPLPDTNANDSLFTYGTTNGGDATSISDSNGNLLFYASSTGVFNRKHWSMPNGLFFEGPTEAEQGAIIIPRPNRDNQYFFFT